MHQSFPATQSVIFFLIKCIFPVYATQLEKNVLINFCVWKINYHHVATLSTCFDAIFSHSFFPSSLYISFLYFFLLFLCIFCWMSKHFLCCFVLFLLLFYYLFFFFLHTQRWTTHIHISTHTAVHHRKKYKKAFRKKKRGGAIHLLGLPAWAYGNA